MKVRLAKIDDKERVLKLYEEAKVFINNYNSPQWQATGPGELSFNFDLNNNYLFVLENNNEIIGVASIMDYEETYNYIVGSWLNDDSYYVIHRFVISNEYKGQNLAYKFIEYTIEKLNAKNIKIDTHRLNIPMQNFLLKNNFKYTGVIYLNDEDDNERLAYQLVV